MRHPGLLIGLIATPSGVERVVRGGRPEGTRARALRSLFGARWMLKFVEASRAQASSDATQPAVPSASSTGGAAAAAPVLPGVLVSSLAARAADR
eukprot:9492587-Pyramimonas_sp.AAC.1